MSNTAPICFFCSKSGDDLRQVMTFEVHERVRLCADILEDSMLRARLGPSDMIAMDAKYHLPCLLTLYRIQKAIHKLNPGQCPGVAVDQPLFATVKQIQWHWPNQFGEDKFVILMGGLHIDMAALRLLGHWLDGCGWVQYLIQADIASSGVAVICCSHVKHTRLQDMHTQ